MEFGERDQLAVKTVTRQDRMIQLAGDHRPRPDAVAVTEAAAVLAPVAVVAEWAE